MKQAHKNIHFRSITQRRPVAAQDSNPATIFFLDIVIAILDLVIRQKN